VSLSASYPLLLILGSITCPRRGAELDRRDFDHGLKLAAGDMPTELGRDDGRAVVQGLRALIGHLEEEQEGDLLGVGVEG
jgi:hypothetical protein